MSDDSDPFADVPLFDSLSLQPAPATPTVAPVRSETSGKQGGVSPPVLGVVDPTDTRGGVFLLTVSELGNSVCGAKVGAKGCMCIASTVDCTFSSHRSAKSKLDPSVFGNAASVLLIQVPGMRRRNVAFIQPALDTSSLSGAIIGNYQRQQRTVAEWQTVFQSVSTAVRSGAPASVMAKRSMAVGFSDDAITPRTKRHRYSDDPEEAEAESESSPYEAVGVEELPKELPGRSEAENIGAVLTLWPSLVQALGRAQEGVSDLNSALTSFKVTVSDDVDVLEDKIANDRTLIGRRPEDAGTASLWDAITELKDVVGKLSPDDGSNPRGSEIKDLLKDAEDRWKKTVVDLETAIRNLDGQLGSCVTLDEVRLIFDRRTKAMMDGVLGRTLTSLGSRLNALEMAQKPAAATSLPLPSGLTRGEVSRLIEDKLDDLELDFQDQLKRHALNTASAAPAPSMAILELAGTVG